MRKFLLFAAILFVYPVDFAFANCGQSLINECKKAGTAARGVTEAGGKSARGNLQGGAEDWSNALNAGSAAMSTAASKCRSSKSRCKQQCTTPQDIKKCEEDVENAAASLGSEAGQLGGAGADAGQTAQSAGGGGEGLGQALGAMAPLLAALMQKKQEEKKKEEDGALQPNGSIDCSKGDAYIYQDCNEQLSAACRNAPEDGRCVNFANRYCSGSASGGAPAVLPPAQTVRTGSGLAIASAPPMGQQGEGIGTDFCGFVAAYNYCKSGGRDNCPSCRQLQRESSAFCAQNPSSCIGQNSPEQVARARTTCPTDPIFANPTYAQPGFSNVATGSGAPPTPVTGGAPVMGGAPIGGGSGAPVPVAVLPQSANSRAAGGGMREAAARGAASDSASGGASASGGSANGATSGGRADVAAGGGRIMPSSSSPQAATSNAGPAPDVQGMNGPSVFAMGTQVIRSRCAAGKLVNCP